MSKRSGITRRGLFRGIGTATLVAGCATPKAPPPEGPAQTPPVTPGVTLGPGPAPLQFELNGQAVTTEVPPSATLLDTLRLRLDATGTKKVCDRGSCGACMVLVDGQPQNSCMTLAHDVAGRKVTTVEGLGAGHDGGQSPLQRAFVERDALQCGFCTPGMLISCTALLARTGGAAPSADAIQDAISGNLCRCGTYPHVVAAVKSAAGGGA
ncbi:MAG: (2Fe-2S)-binding protein [Myxococcales bacterium]|nr:(2Fe-2S)-binding protein [Myxococcales bacterium]